MEVKIKNNGTAAINNWTLVWQFAGDQKITNLWNGRYTQDGTVVTVKNAAYNGTIAAGDSVDFGFTMNYNGSNPQPVVFTLNGTACRI